MPLVVQHIGRKIVLTVGPAVALGLLTISVVHDIGEETAIIDQHERAVRAMLESSSRGLQTVMLAGYADIAQVFADNLKTVPNVIDFRILRPDGAEAFRDNKTIQNVNARKGQEVFPLRDREEVIQVLPSSHPELARAVEERRIVDYKEIGCVECGNLAKEVDRSSTAATDAIMGVNPLGSGKMLTLLAPIPNREPCQKCHGGDHQVRGVIKITTSLEPILAEIEKARFRAGIVLLVTMVGVIGLISLMMRRFVVAPIERVTEAMRVAAHGDLTQQVPVIGGDEISLMASSFNKMLAQLLSTYTGLQDEQNKLTTIILSAREGIAVTDGANRLVLVNPACERLLDKSAQSIVEGGILNLFDNPKQMQSWLDRTSVGEAEIFEYKERILSVYAATIRSEARTLIGSAALIRDITEERHLQNKLWEMSVTDVLTGLFNRRYLDMTMTSEVERSLRYKTPLSILMFDVDHFKKFNDTYGHDMGDKVLQATAATAKATLRSADLPCRYGGEEFLIILPSIDLEQATQAGERVRSAIERMRVEGLSVTVSIGAASLLECGLSQPGQLIELADKCLYEAKHAGRNRVVAAARLQDESAAS
jgi:diguanylate cyclase (GGDEF)-like protein/PAS domain S-box-containing protein